MTVEDTLRIAIDALGGQKDLAGAPAILHALAVGLMGQNELEQNAWVWVRVRRSTGVEAVTSVYLWNNLAEMSSRYI